MFAGPLSPRKTLNVQYLPNLGDGALNHKIDLLMFVLYILNLKGHQNCIIHSKVMTIFVGFMLGFLYLWKPRKSQTNFGKSQDF